MECVDVETMTSEPLRVGWGRKARGMCWDVQDLQVTFWHNGA